MDIKLSYDPVKPQTCIQINEQSVDGADIYGFLYPVRQCLLQTWLKPTGSWNGLSFQLQEIARGESIDLTFCGREQDWEDVKAELENMEGLTLHFEENDPLLQYNAFFAAVDEGLDFILDLPEDKSSHHSRYTMRDIFFEAAERIEQIRKADSNQWYTVIRNHRDLQKAAREELSCCIIADEYLDSFEKLEQLRMLNRSMRRSMDMICCCISDSVKREEFAQFARQYDDCAIRFAAPGDRFNDMWKKYGEPAVIRSRIRSCHEIAVLLHEVFDQKKRFEEERNRLSSKNCGIPEPERERQREKCRGIIKWFILKSEKFAELERLLSTVKPSAALVSSERGLLNHGK